MNRDYRLLVPTKIDRNVHTLYAAVCFDPVEGTYDIVFRPNPFRLDDRPEYIHYDPIDYYTMETALDLTDLQVSNGGLFPNIKMLKRFVLQAGIMENPYEVQLEFTLCPECNGLHNELVCPYCNNTD